MKPLPMNLKIASLIINDLRILRFQRFKARKGFRRILTLDWLPPDSPQCNPQEWVRRELRRQPFGYHDYRSMRTVEKALMRRLQQLESAPDRIH